jgi:hypothetical protein
LAWLSCLALLAACQSAPVTDVWISPKSSLLAVDVLFPEPLNRDPSLVQAWFLKGTVAGEGETLAEPIPATFVKWSRAYLLDPEPGLYSLAAVAAEYAPPWNTEPIDGITQTTSSGISADAVIFPAELIRRTTAAVAPGRVVFLGVLHVRRGEHISADAVPADDLQARLADRIRPGATGLTGIRAWLARARVVDLANTTFRNGPADREAFLDSARADLGESPWAAMLARQAPAPAGAPVARRPAPAPIPRPAAKIEPPPVPSEVKREPEAPAQRPAPIREPEEEVAPPQAADLEPSPVMAEPEAEPAPEESEIALVEPVAPIPEPEPPVVAPDPEPEPEPFPNVPSDSPLAQVRPGMRHDEVLRILGSPDGRIDRLTPQAWIPFRDSRGDTLREWIYTGKGRVVFSLYQGSLEVVDVVYDPRQETSRPLLAPPGRR